MAPKLGSKAYQDQWRRAWERMNPGKKLPAVPAWTPWKPDPVPPGLYDPSLDAQAGQINRGYGDTLADAAIGSTRRAEDEAQGREDLHFQRQGVDRNLMRTLHGLDQSFIRGNQDYDTGVAALQRSFRHLGNQQAQQQRAFGVARGGAALQAARKRMENEALERQPLDTAWARQREDIDRARTQTREDAATDYASLDRAGARLTVGGQRAGQDADLGVFRAGRETDFAGLDVDSLRRFQAVGAGWQPSTAPSNEFADAQGNPYRVVRQGRFNARVSPAGYVINRTRRR